MLAKLLAQQQNRLAFGEPTPSPKVYLCIVYDYELGHSNSCEVTSDNIPDALSQLNAHFGYPPDYYTEDNSFVIIVKNGTDCPEVVNTI